MVMAVVIAFNLFDGLQRDVPSYTTALQGSANVRKQLNSSAGSRRRSPVHSTATTLVNCGPAPNSRRSPPG